MQGLVDSGRRGDAVKLFMRTVGAPAFMVALMRSMPVWSRLTAVARTLPYDLALVLPHEQAAIAGAVAGARLEVLPGQTHMVRPKAVAPVVAEFLAAGADG